MIRKSKIDWNQMFEDFKKWFFEDPKKKIIPPNANTSHGPSFAENVVLESTINKSYKPIILWMHDNGEVFYTSPVGLGTIVPSIDSYFVIGKYQGKVLRAYYNYNVNTKNGDHVAIKLVCNAWEVKD